MQADLFEYLETQDAPVLDRLYECNWTTQSILRALPSVAKSYVLRLLYMDDITRTELDSWAEPKAVADEHRYAVNELLKLRVMMKDPKNPDILSLNPVFRKQVQTSLVTGVTKPWQKLKTGKRLAADSKAPELETVEHESQERWQSLLYFIVASESRKRPPRDVIELLLTMGLVRKSRELKPEITNDGCQFIMMDIQAQIWKVMKHYILKSESPGDILKMVFCMSFCSPGTMCAVEALTETQKDLLADFEKFGLIWRRKPTSRRFYPTSLGVNIVFDRKTWMPEEAADKSIAEEGLAGLSLVLESNFKVYAYTMLELHAEMLNLFVDIECILPNLVVGLITRSSITKALNKGIKAQQIIHFLTSKIHPKCLMRTNVIPDNVTDQILLWEKERSRIKYDPGWMFSRFDSPQLFKSTLKFCTQMGLLVWSDSERIFVSHENKPRVNEYIKTEKKRLNNR